jgi:hypothetical protein
VLVIDRQLWLTVERTGVSVLHSYYSGSSAPSE